MGRDAVATAAALWCLILVATALRLVVAACFGPGNDEAYHDLYAQHLDWSYFDHPRCLPWSSRRAWLWWASTHRYSP